MKQLLLAFGFLLAASLAFAGGQSEEVTVNGTISAVESTSDGGATVTVTTDGGDYTVQLSQSELSDMDLQPGAEISVNGAEMESEDGETEIEFDAIEYGGTRYERDFESEIGDDLDGEAEEEDDDDEDDD